MKAGTSHQLETSIQTRQLHRCQIQKMNKIPAIIKLSAALGAVWWLCFRDARPPGSVGPVELPTWITRQNSINDVVLSQEICAHMRNDAIRRSPGQAVRVAVSIDTQALNSKGEIIGWTYRVRYELRNASGVFSGVSGSVVQPAGRRDITVLGSIRTPELGSRNTYQMRATLQALKAGARDVLNDANWIDVVDTRGRRVVRVLENALTVVPAGSQSAHTAAINLDQVHA